jgi:CDP-diacylglycerol pyrophosphatase
MRRDLVSPLVGALLAAGSLQTSALAGNPNKLWEIVHDECVPSKLRTGDPSPCAVVNLHSGVGHGYAALKDLVGEAQYLLIPTSRISGIESPSILAPDAPNYFSLAWRWRSLIERRLRRPVPRATASVSPSTRPRRARRISSIFISIACARMWRKACGASGQASARAGGRSRRGFSGIATRAYA